MSCNFGDIDNDGYLTFIWVPGILITAVWCQT